MNINLQTQSLPADSIAGGLLTINETTGGTEDGMPPGSVYLYVIEDSTSQGDFDLDGDVDESDLSHLVQCLTGPDGVHGDLQCRDADLNDDQDADLNDFAIFQDHYTGTVK